MEKGSFRCDANVSLRPVGSTELGSKVEVKNMNSFRAVFKALEFEVVRQAERLRQGDRIVQETRGWIDGEEITVSQRTKEYAADYRYFPEPDLPPLRIGRELVSEIEASLPELPKSRFARFKTEYALGDFEAGLLTEDQSRADFYESAVQALAESAPDDATHKVANWMTGELARIQNERNESLADLKIKPEHFGQLVALIDGGTISSKLAKTVFETMYETGQDPGSIVKESEVKRQISDEAELRPPHQRPV